MSTDSSGKGMEFWNPIDDSVTMTVNELPQEIGQPTALGKGSLVAINQNTELIISDGFLRITFE